MVRAEKKPVGVRGEGNGAMLLARCATAGLPGRVNLMQPLEPGVLDRCTWGFDDCTAGRASHGRASRPWHTEFGVPARRDSGPWTLPRLPRPWHDHGLGDESIDQTPPRARRRDGDDPRKMLSAKDSRPLFAPQRTLRKARTAAASTSLRASRLGVRFLRFDRIRPPTIFTVHGSDPFPDVPDKP